MNEIVDAFKIDVTSAELKVHFEKHLAHHRNALEILGNNKIQLIGAKGTTSDVIKKHRMQIKLLDYVTAHLPENVTYRVTLHELEGMMIFQSLTDSDDE